MLDLKFWSAVVQFAVFLVLTVRCNEAPTIPTPHHVSTPTTTPVPTYTEEHFIPSPHWSPVHGPLVFNSTEDLQTFRERLNTVNTRLINVSYNSANSLITLYNDYKEVEHKYDRNLAKFYLHYQPLVHEEHLNCVGLTIALKKRCVQELQADYPDIDKYLFYTAGEMQLGPDNDLLTRATLRGDEKWKHVALAMHFSIGERPGYFLMDQSFGVPVVTLMQDKMTPHQDSFSVPYKYNKDEYLYSLCDNGFVNFTRYCLDFLSTEKRQATGGFYLRRAHDSILNITEKRAVIKTKRSIVSRLPTIKRPLDVDVLLDNGTYIEVYEPGKYFPHYVAGKINLARTNLSDPDLGLDVELRLKVGRWGHELKYPMYGFLHLVRNLSRIAQDKHFLSQLRRLDNVINNRTGRFLTSVEYNDSDQQENTDILYDNFVQYINSLTSKEVFEIWRTYSSMSPGKDGQTPSHLWPEHTFCSLYPTHHPNATPPASNESLELRTRHFNHQSYQVPDLDLK